MKEMGDHVGIEDRLCGEFVHLFKAISSETDSLEVCDWFCDQERSAIVTFFSAILTDEVMRRQRQLRVRRARLKNVDWVQKLNEYQARLRNELGVLELISDQDCIDLLMESMCFSLRLIAVAQGQIQKIKILSAEIRALLQSANDLTSEAAAYSTAIYGKQTHNRT